jgi:hypothetical protein
MATPLRSVTLSPLSQTSSMHRNRRFGGDLRRLSRVACSKRRYDQAGNRSSSHQSTYYSHLSTSACLDCSGATAVVTSRLASLSWLQPVELVRTAYSASPMRKIGNGGAADPATKEALRYRTALHTGFRSLGTRPLCTSTAVQVCSTIKGAELDVRRVPGTNLVNETDGAVIYTPRRRRAPFAGSSQQLGAFYSRTGGYRSSRSACHDALPIRGDPSFY